MSCLCGILPVAILSREPSLQVTMSKDSDNASDHDQGVVNAVEQGPELRVVCSPVFPL